MVCGSPIEACGAEVAKVGLAVCAVGDVEQFGTSTQGITHLTAEGALHFSVEVGVVFGHSGGCVVEGVVVLGKIVLVLETSAKGRCAKLLTVYPFATNGVAVSIDNSSVVDRCAIFAKGVRKCVVVLVDGVLAYHVQLHLLAVGHLVGIEEVEFG